MRFSSRIRTITRRQSNLAQEIREAFPDISVTDCDPLSLSVSCHIGPGALAVAVSIVY